MLNRTQVHSGQFIALKISSISSHQVHPGSTRNLLKHTSHNRQVPVGGDILNFVLCMRPPNNIPAVRNSLDGNRIAS